MVQIGLKHVYEHDLPMLQKMYKVKISRID